MKERESQMQDSLHSILSRPLPRCCLIPGPVCLVQMSDVRYERVVRVRVCQH